MRSSCSPVSLRHSTVCMLFVFVLVALISLMTTATVVYADTFQVTTTSDDISNPAEGSLRYAIQNATSQDVITFELEYPATITLTEQLSIDHGLTIQGPGSDLLAVSGGGECRVFYIEDTSESVDISGISIVSGDAGSDFGDYAGGIYNLSDKLTVDNCRFSGNSADEGGGMYNYESSPTVTNCTFSSNSADDGGGMHNKEFSSPEVRNCTFTGNSAYYGGGMYNSFYSSPIATNCTFAENSADDDGGGMYSYNSSPKVTNCIFWGDTGEIYNDLSNLPNFPKLSFCVVQSNDVGEGTLSSDIISADPILQPLADNGGPTWTCALGEGSSAIDAGIESILIDLTTIKAPDTDQRGHERPWGTGYDIGAYEVDVESFTIIPYWTTGGIITPVSTVVFQGNSLDFTISPDISYHIEEIYVDGDSISFESVENKYTYTFHNVSADHWLFAIFEPDGDDGDSDDDDDIPDNDDDNVDDSTRDDDSAGNNNTGGGGGGGCNISALPGIALLLLVPMIFLSGKMN